MSSRPAKLYVIAAPSGAGKTTLVRFLLERNPGIKFSVSYTTREKRKTEVDGRDYFFIDKKRFAQLKEEGELLESALVFDNYYGTSRTRVEQQLAKGNHVMLEIDWQGARQVRESVPGCVTIFILPPGRQELERRLRDRRTDSDKVIAHRLQEAHGDMSHWDEFDFVIINDDLETAVGELEAVLHGEGAANRSSNPELQQKLQNILV
jgi:guanylate kinase